MLLIAAFLVAESWSALREIGPARFLTDAGWRPTQGRYGLAPMVAGTAAVTGGAMALALPLGVASAVFCRFYAPAGLGRAYRAAIELLAGIPSVVYGLWGLVVLVPLVGAWHPPGASLLAGILVLALMIVPTVALTALSALRAVPASTLRGAEALGLSRRAVAWGVAVPAARSGLVVGGLLAAGRALGETMALLMVCGNVVQVPGGLFDPVRTLTANIALEMAYATEGHRAALFVCGLVLMAVVALLVLAAEALERGSPRGA